MGSVARGIASTPVALQCRGDVGEWTQQTQKRLGQGRCAPRKQPMHIRCCFSACPAAAAPAGTGALC